MGETSTPDFHYVSRETFYNPFVNPAGDKKRRA